MEKEKLLKKIEETENSISIINELILSARRFEDVFKRETYDILIRNYNSHLKSLENERDSYKKELKVIVKIPPNYNLLFFIF